MRYKFLFLLCYGAVFFMVGCETVRGLGKDLENTGENIQAIVSPDAEEQPK